MPYSNSGVGGGGSVGVETPSSIAPTPYANGSHHDHGHYTPHSNNNHTQNSSINGGGNIDDELDDDGESASSLTWRSSIPTSRDSMDKVNKYHNIQQNQLHNGNNTTQITISKRIEIDALVTDFRKKLGKNWDNYQITISLFLVGKLSRNELMTELKKILDKQTIRLHNQLLLSNLANSLSDFRPDQDASTSGFGNQINNLNKKRKISSSKSSQYEMIQKDILALSIRERKRLKAITKDSGRKGILNSIVTMTRQSLVPKVPIATTHDAALGGNTSSWGTEVLQSIQTPLCSESYELPDNENLKLRMLGISREHGLLGKIDNKSIEFLISGLESYLRSIIETSIDTVKYRRRKYELNDVTDGGGGINNNSMKIGKKNNKKKKNRKIILTVEDMFDTFEKLPHLIEPGEPNLSLRYNRLQNDDMIDFSNLKYTKLKENSSGGNSSNSNNHNISDNNLQIKSPFTSPIKDNITSRLDKSDISLQTNEQQKNGSIVKIEKQELNGSENTNTSTNSNTTSSNSNNNSNSSNSSNSNNLQRTRQQHTINLSLSDPNLGTSNELNSLLNDLLST
ncbi:hypothetical protein BVG19_g3696 [[Candida] boidinii]|nr:hypothetical protein BVG19_g3696 [[Candida] boidinii]OWB52500.1 hypothetical protein B5S27_g4076 [[Candida] boidinii]